MIFPRTAVTTKHHTNANEYSETYLLDIRGKIKGRHYGQECCQPCDPRPDNHPKLDLLVKRHLIHPFVLILLPPAIPPSSDPTRLVG